MRLTFVKISQCHFFYFDLEIHSSIDAFNELYTAQ